MYLLHIYSVIRQIAADTFALMSVCCDDGGNLQLLTPFHFLALLDPKAQWFRKWMVCMYVCVSHRMFSPIMEILRPLCHSLLVFEGKTQIGMQCCSDTILHLQICLQ